MKTFLIFIGGFISGILATLFFIFIISLGISSNNSKNELEVQYIEITGKYGTATVHTGMSKDSVQILLGKPDEVDLDEMFNTHYEKWGYNIKNEYIADLVIEFENAKLKGVRQH
jgi:hypothetical protein